jgi:hypothetical protein
VAIVVGTFDDHDAITALSAALKNSGVDVSKLRVVGNEEVPTELAAPEVEYVWLGDVGGTRATGLENVEQETGTGVPGLTSGGSRPVSSPELGDYLSDLGIPDAKTDTYGKAVDAGKWLAGYPVYGDGIEPVKSAFTSAGAKSVEVF